MATQGIGTARQGRRSVTLTVMVAVALAFTIAVLVTQASSIWSAHTGSGQPVSQVRLSSGDYTMIDRAPGCVPKYGCPDGETP